MLRAEPGVCYVQPPSPMLDHLQARPMRNSRIAWLPYLPGKTYQHSEDRSVMLPATRDIWQGHPSTQAWKVDQESPDLVTELHHAAWSGDTDKIMALLAQGSSAAAPDREGRSPLHYAAAGDQAGTIILLANNRADTHSRSAVGDSALHVAAAQGNVAAIHALLSQGANAAASNDQEHTPLYAAVAAKQSAAVQALCEAGAHAVNTADEWGLSPLHIAARAGDADTVTLLLIAKANPMQQSWDKRTPLHFAAQHRHPTVIRQLLFHPSLRQNPTSALQHPSGFALQDLPVQPALQQHQQALYTNGHQAQDISEAVLPNLPLSLHKPYNAQIEVQNSKQADLVSGHASIQDAASSLQSLQSGIQYEPYAAGTTSRQEPDTRSNSSVDSAEELDYTGEDAHAMEALLALTSDCSVQSPSQSQNPADHFSWQQHLLGLKDHQGNTALHLAAMEGLPESVQLLLQAGADTTMLGMQLQTPLMMARQFRHAKVAEMLLHVGNG